MKKILVTGAGGFIGGHLVKELINREYQVRATDIKPFDEWYQCFDKVENLDRLNKASFDEICILYICVIFQLQRSIFKSKKCCINDSAFKIDKRVPDVSVINNQLMV